MQKDVRPYLWASDALVLPSHYETFSRAAAEAAAAGLPLLVTPLHGVEEYLVDGRNGVLMDKTSQGVAEGIKRFVSLSPESRKAMGRQAMLSVERYCSGNFVDGWRRIYSACGSE